MYILLCKDDSYYVGSTRNIEVRLWQHQEGLAANFTKKRRPVKLIYTETYHRIDDAFYREQQIKKWSREKKKALIEKNYQRLSLLSENNQ